MSIKFAIVFVVMLFFVCNSVLFAAENIGVVGKQSEDSFSHYYHDLIMEGKVNSKLQKWFEGIKPAAGQEKHQVIEPPDGRELK